MFSVTSITYLAACLLGAVATLFATPFYGILLYQLNFFVDPPSRWWFGELPRLRYSFIIMFLVLVGFGARWGEFRANRLARLPQLKWLLALLVVVLVTYFWAVNPETHAKFTSRYCKVIIFTLLAYKLVDTQEKMEKLLGVYLTGIAYIAYLAWQQGRTDFGRLEGLGCADTNDANGTAAVMVTALPILVFYLLFGKTLMVRLLSLVGCAFVMNSLILFNSRGAFISLIVGAAYFLWFVFREKLGKMVKMKVVAGVAVAIALFFYLADETFWTRMDTLQDAPGQTTGTSRVTFWMAVFDMLESHPLGTGARGFEYLSPLYLPAESLSRGMRAVHSTWFEALSEYGYHGLFLFSAFLGSCFLLMRRVRVSLRASDDGYLIFQSVALETALVCLLVAGSFINFFYGELMYWLPLYIGAFANIHLFSKEQLKIVADGVP